MRRSRGGAWVPLLWAALPLAFLAVFFVRETKGIDLATIDEEDRAALRAERTTGARA